METASDGVETVYGGMGTARVVAWKQCMVVWKQPVVAWKECVVAWQQPEWWRGNS